MPSRLLLIDDEPTGLMALSEALKQRLADTVIDTAMSTRAALLLLREHDYHVVVSDIRMAGLDGLALLNQVRERWPEVPVIMITAGGTEREPEALISGAFAFLEKPVDIDRLVALVRVAMEKKLLHQRVQEANRQSLSQISLQAEQTGFSFNPNPPTPETPEE